MRKVQFLVIFLLFANFGYPNNDSLMVWQKDRMLTWSDFEAIPPSEDKGAYVEDAIANIEIEVIAKWKGYEPAYVVRTYFNKQLSWTRVKDSKLLLSHEQLHFDIGELYARKIRKAWLKLKQKGELKDEVYLSTAKKLITEFKDFTIKYDEDTSHGLLKGKQKEWNKKIRDKLNELEEYSID